jgi:hypothetical protein
MDLYDVFDVQVSQDAKTFPLGDGASIDLLPLSSDIAKRKFDELMDPYQSRIAAGVKLTEEENKKINLKFFAETIIRGWKGLREKPTAEQAANKEPGDLIPYTPENATKLFEALPRFFAMVFKLASDEDAFAIKKTADEEKNS